MMGYYDSYNPEIANLRRQIGEKIKRVMGKRGENVGEFVEKYHENFSLTRSSFAQYIASVRVGKMMGATTNASKGFPYRRLELKRLSKLLELLEIPEEETPIREIRLQYSD